MPKLKKTKAFTVSDEIIEVDFKGTICECANLLKSGIMHQTTILVSYDDIWNEVNILNLGGDDSNLQAFSNFIQTMKLSLVDLGIVKEEKKTDFSLKHDDFVSLSELFAEYDYIQISKLNDFEIENVGRTGMAHLKESLKHISEKKLTIDEYILQSKQRKSKIIKDMKTEEVGADNKTAIPVEKIEVIGAEIVSPEFPVNRTEIVSTPAAKKPISLQVFETLTPDRISELQGLKEAQLLIVKNNPVITITDKETYETAKKTAAALLSASTNIDGTNGLATQANKYLNTFKTMLKTAFDPIAKLTRDPYDQQKQIISAWENAEELKKQALEREKLLKIKQRTDRLFAVPFIFNGTLYSIGTIYVTPSQIEGVTDAEFDVIISNGNEVKKIQDAELLKQSAVEEENRLLREKLAKYEALENMSNTEPEPNVIVQKPMNNGTSEPAINQVVNNVSEKTTANVSATAPAHTLPSIENEFLNRLDLEHIEHIEKPAYIKCRGYYVRALIDVSKELEFILNDSTPNALKKSERISNLAAILKQSV